MTKLTITLTADQQKQIKDATGKSVSALILDQDQLTEKDLDQATGGVSIAYEQIQYQYYTQDRS